MESIEAYFAALEQTLRSISRSDIRKVFSLLEDAYRNGRRVFIMGNGGSAATASHFALDLAKNTIVPGAPRLKAISLTDHVPLITAWSNDTAYEHVFAEQLAPILEPADLVIGISASGNSLNVINALRLAKESGAYTIGLLGGAGGKIKPMVDAYVLAPGPHIEQEEDAHLILAHVITRHMRHVVRGHAETLAVSGAVASPVHKRRGQKLETGRGARPALRTGG
jgi:D-sedoheptulose 7-phosphate isomerase